MSKTLNTIIAIALVGLFPALSIYAGTQGDVYTEENAVLSATQFLKGSPTYSFDGIEETIDVVNVDTLRMPYAWSVTIKFTSRNGGYGNRAGQMVLTALTEHEMVIVVQKDVVLSARTDGVFDEINEVLLDQNTPENAEEIALEWLRNAPTFSFDGIEGTMIVEDVVIAESYPVQYFIKISFDCSHPGYGDRSGLVLAQVITGHKARITVSDGEVRNAIIDDTWNEFNQGEDSPAILTPEEAVNIIVDYLKENYAEASELEITEEWSIANTTPEGLLGSSSLEYSGDGWNIKISWPVVWKPTYMVEVEHGEFAWSGTVDQDGLVTEHPQ